MSGDTLWILEPGRSSLLRIFSFTRSSDSFSTVVKEKRIELPEEITIKADAWSNEDLRAKFEWNF